MFEQLKLVFQQMGQGLLQQHLGEVSAAVERVEKRSQKFHLAGGQSRIVLIASTDPLSPAFDFVVDLAKQTRSLIEVLYITPADETKSTLNTLLNRLGGLSCDFQITYLTGDLFEKLADYSYQRQDIMAVVCGSSEDLAEKLRPAPQTLDPVMRFTFPTVVFIDNSIIA